MLPALPLRSCSGLGEVGAMMGQASALLGCSGSVREGAKDDEKERRSEKEARCVEALAGWLCTG